MLFSIFVLEPAPARSFKWKTQCAFTDRKEPLVPGGVSVSCCFCTQPVWYGHLILRHLYKTHKTSDYVTKRARRQTSKDDKICQQINVIYQPTSNIPQGAYTGMNRVLNRGGCAPSSFLAACTGDSCSTIDLNRTWFAGVAGVTHVLLIFCTCSSHGDDINYPTVFNYENIPTFPVHWEIHSAAATSAAARLQLPQFHEATKGLQQGQGAWDEILMSQRIQNHRWKVASAKAFSAKSHA